MSLYYVQKFLRAQPRREGATGVPGRPCRGARRLRADGRGEAGTRRARHRPALCAWASTGSSSCTSRRSTRSSGPTISSDAAGPREPWSGSRGRRRDRIRGRRCARSALAARTGGTLMPLVFAVSAATHPASRPAPSAPNPDARGAVVAFDGWARHPRDAARRDHGRRCRALRQLLHEQHALVRDRHGRLLRRPDRRPPTAHQARRGCRATMSSRRRFITGVMNGRRVLRRGVAVRPWHHRAAALPDAATTTCR